MVLLGKVAAYALTLTSFFYCQVSPALRPEGCLRWPFLEIMNSEDLYPMKHSINGDIDTDELDKLSESNGIPVSNGKNNVTVKPPMFQKGVLRTNCIDCLDRTNVAQYAYGLAALGHQLHALGVIESPKVDLDAPLASELMGFYERMGDTLAHQYGGSAAHNKIFSQRRGQWKAATQSQEFFRTLQRYYSNAYMDAEKQDAINVFLGHFQPQEGKPALWELESDQHCNMKKSLNDENGSTLFKRCFSDGNIPHEGSSLMSATNVNPKEISNFVMPVDSSHGGSKFLSESSPEISTSETDIASSRYAPSTTGRRVILDMPGDQFLESGHIHYNERADSFSYSNFVDLDWLSSSGNSCEEEPYERSFMNSSVVELSSENVVNGIVGETTPSTSEYGFSMKVREQTGTEPLYGSPRNSDVIEEFSDSFVRWVTYGEALCH